MKPFVKTYLKKQQKQFVLDLKESIGIIKIQGLEGWKWLQVKIITICFRTIIRITRNNISCNDGRIYYLLSWKNRWRYI